MTMKQVKKRNNPANIKWKIFAYLLGFCGILLILLWLFQVVFLDNFYKAIKVNEIRQSATTLVKNLENENLPELINEIALKNDIYVELVAENGVKLSSVYAARENILDKMPMSEKMNLITRAISNGGEFLSYYNRDNLHGRPYDMNILYEKPGMPERVPMETILYAKAVSEESGNRIVILINSMISPLDATVKTLRVQLYYITGFMILFSVVLAFLISKNVAGPIQKINKAAKMLASGRYDTDFTAGGYREIIELSETLNHTAQELSKVENLRRELIANVSHDLRTPLTLIGGYAEAMRDLPAENTPENAQIIMDEASRLSVLVNDLLNLSKIQSGTQTLNLSNFNLTRQLKQVILNMTGLVKKEGYHIQFLYDEEVNVTADETLISQAFYNLLVNAINYSGSDQTVTVRQVLSEGRIKIEVSDPGEGIAAENLPYVWDRYYKADKNHKRAVTGTGIGLSIVKSIMDMHRGEYGVESTPKEGSTFWILLNRSV
jgi:signal transduction histidine kinase